MYDARAMKTSRPLAIALACIAQGACLDATSGAQAGDAADTAQASDAVPDTTVVAPCPTAGTRLELLESDTGDFALGRCGALAFWSEASPRALRFLSASHDIIASHVDGNGFSGNVRISSSGTYVVASSVRSDLGFGDAAIGAFPSRGAFEVTRTIDFGGDPRIPSDRPLLVGELLVYSERLEDVQIYTLDLAAGTAPQAITGMQPDWLYGSSQRTRDAFRVSSDGSRIVLISVCEAFGAGSCKATVRTVFDNAGSVLATPTDWHDPLIGPGPIIAASSDDGTVVLDAAGTVHTIAGRTPVAVMHDHVITTRDARYYANFVDAVPTDLGAASTVVTSSGAYAAALFQSSESDNALSLWRNRKLVRADPMITYTKLVHVSDDGITLALGAGQTVLLDVDGTVLHQWSSHCARNAQRVGGNLFFELCGTPNDELHRFDVTTHDDVLIAEGHDFDYQADATATYVAFTYLPLSGTRRELHAGRITP